MWARFLALLLLAPFLRGQVVDETEPFLTENDDPGMKAALNTLLALATDQSILLTPTGEPGNLPWDTPGVSYCDWWGVTCCGIQLAEYKPICRYGPQSVSGLQLQNVDFIGTLPDLFDEFPDLQLLDISSNRGV